MDKLQEIGFYTLEDARAQQASDQSPLWRCELILTPACNFNCAYCRPIRDDYRSTFLLGEAKRVVSEWASHGLRNIRFSGGEPTLWPGLVELVRFTKQLGVRRIALSTNGSASVDLYDDLVTSGVDDFSISLDACCSSTGDGMAGVPDAFETIINNIRHLSTMTYVTVGIVVTEENVGELNKTIALADDLGVSDIRVISAAQWNEPLEDIVEIDSEMVSKYPILKYRLANSMHVRGLRALDNNRCPLALDDMAVAGGKHFPCIIYMREHGDPVGTMGPMCVVRQERREWAETHDTHADPICSANCLDVCIDYNNRHREFNA